MCCTRGYAPSHCRSNEGIKFYNAHNKYAFTK